MISILYRGPESSGGTTSVGWIHEHGEPPIEYAGSYLAALQRGAPSRKLTWRIGAGLVRLQVRHDPRGAITARESSAETERFLRMANGVVFVADSQSSRLDANLETLESLRSDFAVAGRSLDDLPVVFQLNKRDLPGGLSVEALRDRLQTRSCAYVESIATEGRGVAEALETCISMVLEGGERSGAGLAFTD